LSLKKIVFNFRILKFFENFEILWNFMKTEIFEIVWKFGNHEHFEIFGNFWNFEIFQKIQSFR
jgi:hypothetical protein